ncbi:hypothetical protein [Amycolatopsis granulosa]|uniref:hypothetical protein n=1 Tax=Amycolatopsis granulosa TaxID=185684 RepID=UPI001421512B|nr:hypothetical protein [Amycolatopsis granulosa]NIH85179.1 hypothetical protein [Amycolatopsis granulosa]
MKPAVLEAAKAAAMSVIELHEQRFDGPLRPQDLFWLESQRRARTIYFARGPIGSVTCGLTVQYDECDLVVVCDRVPERGGRAVGRRVWWHEYFHYRELGAGGAAGPVATPNPDEGDRDDRAARIEEEADAERREFWHRVAPGLVDDDEELLGIVRGREPFAILGRDVYDTATEQQVEASARLLEHYTTDVAHAMRRWKPRTAAESLFGSTSRRGRRG